MRQQVNALLLDREDLQARLEDAQELIKRLERENERLEPKPRRNLATVYGRGTLTTAPMIHRGNLEKVLAHLAKVGCEVDWNSRTSSGHCRCPAHEDTAPSLAITEKESGRILIHCHAGCQPAAVLAAAGLEWADLSDRVPRFWK